MSIANEILEALKKQGQQVMYVKGVYIFKDGRQLSRNQAMKLTGITAKPRQPKKNQPLYGDYAWVAAINRIK